MHLVGFRCAENTSELSDCFQVQQEVSNEFDRATQIILFGMCDSACVFHLHLTGGKGVIYLVKKNFCFLRCLS